MDRFRLKKAIGKAPSKHTLIRQREQERETERKKRKRCENSDVITMS